VLNAALIGKRYGPFTCRVALEKMREYAFAIAGGAPTVGGLRTAPAGLDPSLWDERRARKNPYGGVIAFPTFAATFAMEAFAAALEDPKLADRPSRLAILHAAQEFELLDVIRPGDVLTTVGTIRDIIQTRKIGLVIIATESKNQDGQPVVKGTWTAAFRVRRKKPARRRSIRPR
jgi:acyl dehydratase